jgi:serine/threonine protein phosphatase PrpC
VADGLGGHAAGEFAAERAVAALLASLAAAPALGRDALAQAFARAGAALHDAQRERPAAFGCRTTAVVLAIEDGRALWAHVGDSRLYLLRGGRVQLHTRDHSVPQALVDAGALAQEEVRHHPDRNRVLRSIGGDEPVEPAFAQAPVALEPGDAFLLCTDGFWELVPEAAMESAWAEASGPADWLRRMERMLLAEARGPYDNYSATAVVVAAPVAGRPEPATRRPGWAARLRARLGATTRPAPGTGLHSAPIPAAGADGPS